MIFEYKIEIIEGMSALEQEKLFNEMGEYKWELISVNNNLAYFIREVTIDEA